MTRRPGERPPPQVMQANRSAPSYTPSATKATTECNGCARSRQGRHQYARRLNVAVRKDKSSQHTSEIEPHHIDNAVTIKAASAPYQWRSGNVYQHEGPDVKRPICKQIRKERTIPVGQLAASMKPLATFPGEAHSHGTSCNNQSRCCTRRQGGHEPRFRQPGGPPM